MLGKGGKNVRETLKDTGIKNWNVTQFELPKWFDKKCGNYSNGIFTM